MAFCKNCGHQISAGVKFCRGCGKVVVAPTQVQNVKATLACSNCGNQLNEEAKFCKSCGTAIITVPPQGQNFQTTSVCTNCGKQLNDGAKFCKGCGSATDKQPQVPSHEENKRIERELRDEQERIEQESLAGAHVLFVHSPHVTELEAVCQSPIHTLCKILHHRLIAYHNLCKLKLPECFYFETYPQ